MIETDDDVADRLCASFVTRGLTTDPVSVRETLGFASAQYLDNLLASSGLPPRYDRCTSTSFFRGTHGVRCTLAAGHAEPACVSFEGYKWFAEKPRLGCIVLGVDLARRSDESVMAYYCGTCNAAHRGR